MTNLKSESLQLTFVVDFVFILRFAYGDTERIAEMNLFERLRKRTTKSYYSHIGLIQITFTAVLFQTDILPRQS